MLLAPGAGNAGEQRQLARRVPPSQLFILPVVADVQFASCTAVTFGAPVLVASAHSASAAADRPGLCRPTPIRY